MRTTTRNMVDWRSDVEMLPETTINIGEIIATAG